MRASPKAPVARALLAVGALTLGSALALAAETPRPGGTAIAVLAPIRRADPAVSVGVPDIFTGCILYDALVRFGEGFKIVPGLAKSWEIAPDGLTYTFHLETASFTDGKPVTSEDVKFSLLRSPRIWREVSTRRERPSRISTRLTPRP